LVEIRDDLVVISHARTLPIIKLRCPTKIIPVIVRQKGPIMKAEDVMGRFSVDVEIANYEDVLRAKDGRLDLAKVRRKTIRGVVDSGAAMMVLPLSVANELGLPVRKDKVKVRYADGRRGRRSEVGPLQVTLNGRDNVFTAIVEPKRDSALIGAIVLEALDLLVDCNKQRLAPRDPDFIVSEIE
jgi:predicted aspartyl protease